MVRCSRHRLWSAHGWLNAAIGAASIPYASSIPSIGDRARSSGKVKLIDPPHSSDNDAAMGFKVARKHAFGSAPSPRRWAYLCRWCDFSDGTSSVRSVLSSLWSRWSRVLQALPWAVFSSPTNLTVQPIMERKWLDKLTRSASWVCCMHL